jgi:hypothetical protein
VYELPRSLFSQGDIFDSIPHVVLDEERSAVSSTTESNAVITHTRTERAILITPDCEVDKPNVQNWIVCPALPLALIGAADQKLVRANRVFSKFFLPSWGGAFTESFVDLNQMSTVSSSFLRTRPRLASLSDEGRAAFYAQFVRWLTRWKLKTVTCPSCGTGFDLAGSLRVRSE